MDKPLKGRPENSGYLVTTNINKGGDMYITLPDELLENLKWTKGDTLDLTLVDNCFDWGEVPSIVLRNITKEQKEKENEASE